MRGHEPDARDAGRALGPADGVDGPEQGRDVGSPVERQVAAHAARDRWTSSKRASGARSCPQELTF